MSWRDLTDKEREALPIGSEGWRYERGTTIPKGQWVETMREPVTLASGVVCVKIRWCSNGVGTPSMQVIGSTENYVQPDHKPGYYPLPKGGYKPAQLGAKPHRPKLEPGEMAFGNIKDPLQKKAPKE